MPPPSPKPSPFPWPFLAVLWAHFFWVLSPSWDTEGYYGYGWFVAPLTFLFAWKRIKALDEERRTHREIPPSPTWLTVALTTLAFSLLAPLRFVEIADPTWRLPLSIHAVILFAFTHGIVGWKLGARRSVSFLPVTIFALSAVPYPFQIEQIFIRELTGGVIKISGELFNLYGRPVTVVGERLESMGIVVEVTEGCSGFRSFQSMVMCSLFFGELFTLKWTPRILLVVIGILAATVMNTIRSMALAQIRFDEGVEAFDAAHDNVGYLAFALSALVLFVIAKLFLETSGPKKKLTRRTVSRSQL
ncbi:MAG: exosortase/archaeosortase family protein [Verrucomicrobiales bacterium]